MVSTYQKSLFLNVSPPGVVRLERHAKSTSFFELEPKGMTLVRRWGGLNQSSCAGQREETYDNRNAVQEAIVHQVRRATRKDYWVGHHHPPLIEAIKENPADEAGYLIYGDWLQEHGDIRGELIHATPEERDRLLKNHVLQLKPEAWQDLELDWRLGFVRKVRFVVSQSWWSTQHDIGRVRRFFKHPSCHFVQIVWLSQPEREGRHMDPRVQEAWTEALPRLPKTVEQIYIAKGPLAGIEKQKIPRVMSAPTNERWADL